MAICNSCKKEISNDVIICPYCGVPYNSTTAPIRGTVDKTPYGLVGCCVPLIGLVLFLTWKDTKPEEAKAAGLGALISTIISTVLIFLVVVFIILAGVGASL